MAPGRLGRCAKIHDTLDLVFFSSFPFDLARLWLSAPQIARRWGLRFSLIFACPVAYLLSLGLDLFHALRHRLLDMIATPEMLDLEQIRRHAFSIFIHLRPPPLAHLHRIGRDLGPLEGPAWERFVP